MDVKIAPSILSCDIGRLDQELDRISNADLVHVDVMDGHFVPNLTWGLPVVEAAVRHGGLPVDTHLMIEDPDRWAVQYAQAGAASVTFHAEAATAPITLARSIRKAGARAAVAFRPSTQIGAYLDFIDEFDMILVMTVEPGFGGQRFLDSTLPKIRQVRKAITDCGAAIQLQVDGGIDKQTILGAAEAGADVFVAGSAVFDSDDPAAQIEALRREANAILNGPKAFLA